MVLVGLVFLFGFSIFANLLIVDGTAGAVVFLLVGAAIWAVAAWITYGTYVRVTPEGIRIRNLESYFVSWAELGGVYDGDQAAYAGGRDSAASLWGWFTPFRSLAFRRQGLLVVRRDGLVIPAFAFSYLSATPPTWRDTRKAAIRLRAAQLAQAQGLDPLEAARNPEPWKAQVTYHPFEWYGDGPRRSEWHPLLSEGMENGVAPESRPPRGDNDPRSDQQRFH